MKSIELLKELKGEGHILIGATNQDYKSNSMYLKKLQEQGFNFCKLFNAILVTHSEGIEAKTKPSAQYPGRVYIKKRIYMVDKEIKKPDQVYFKILKGLGEKLNSNATEFYLIDDQYQNIDGANNSGFTGIQFELPKDSTGKRLSTRKTSNQDLDTAVKKLKSALIENGLYYQS